MAKKKEVKDIVPFQEYAVMDAGGPEVIKELMAENLGGESIDISDLIRIKVPAGGGTIWSIPTIDEADEENTKEIDGIIVYHTLKRAYWKSEYTGSNDPPDCYSDDCMTGIGDPGGNCLTCPFAQFGTGKNNKSQACNMGRIMFILTSNALLPIVLRVPAGSLKSSKKYLLGLTSKRIPVNGVITRLTLSKEKNADGIAYSQINFSMLERIKDVTAIKAYSESLKPFLQNIASSAIKTMDDAPDYDPDAVEDQAPEAENKEAPEAEFAA